MIETLKERVNADAALVRRGRYLTTTFLLEVGDTAWLISIFEGRIVSVTRGPFVMPSSVLCAARAGGRMGEILVRSAAARLERPDGADQAARAEDRRRSAGLHGASALLQGSARQAARAIGGRGMSARFEPIIGRYMHLDLFGRPHRIYVEEAGRGHAAALPAHRRQRRPAVSRADERSAHHGAPPRHRLRHALARQILAARGLAQRGIPAHLGAIHDDGARGDDRARSRQADR